MAAIAKGFRSRAELGLRHPSSVSRNITPSRGGACPHWGGPPPAIRSHADCEATWRGWQRYHMETKGWADIAYTAGFCQHGYILAGRGLGVRTAANGTNDGNQRFHAFVWIGGEGQKPHTDALNALDWLIANARRHGAGWEVVPHQRFTGSACPGRELIRHASRRDGHPIASEPAPQPEPEEDILAKLSEEAQEFLEREYRDKKKHGAAPTSQGHVLRFYRGVRASVNIDDPEMAGRYIGHGANQGARLADIVDEVGSSIRGLVTGAVRLIREHQRS